MKKKRPTEQELLKNLNAYGAHADELTEPLSHDSPLCQPSCPVGDFA